MTAASGADALLRRPGVGRRPGLRAIAGPAIALVAATPLLLAGLVWRASGVGLSGPALLGECPMLDLTGLPCAGCGGSRAFYHLMHGDLEFLDYNWFWPLAALVLLAYGGLVTVRTLRGTEPFGAFARELASRFTRMPWRMGALTAALFAVPWLIAFLNLGTIDAS